MRNRPVVLPTVEPWGSVLANGQPWTENAACVDADPELFYDQGLNDSGRGNEGRGLRIRAAKAICHGCSSRPQCLAFLGGLTPDERQAIKRRKQRKKAGAR